MRVLKASRLVNRNVIGGDGRTSMRMEPEMWQAFEEVCRREGMTHAELIPAIERKFPNEARTSAVRTFLLTYFRQAATEAGHAKAGHGAVEGVA